MKLKTLQNKIIIIESSIIFLLLIIIIFLGIQKTKTPSQLFNMSVSQFEKNNIITIKPKSDEANSFLYFWLNNNEIGNVSYVNGDFALSGLAGDNDTFYSEINYPDFKETSYISPINSGEITDRNIKDIFMFKEFFFHSGKTVGFVLDKEGNATLLDDE